MQNGPGRAIPKSYFGQYEMTSQFEGAERIAEKWGITREEVDAFGLESQVRANRAWAEGRYEREVCAVDAPVLDDDGKPTGDTVRVARDEGLRETSMEKLAALKPVFPSPSSLSANAGNGWPGSLRQRFPPPA